MPRLTRRTLGLQASAKWVADRDFELARDIAGGLGTRPGGWWQFESARPDLADSGLDAYAHLRDDLLPGAVARLRHLAEVGELTAAEVAAIHRGAALEPHSGRYAWRSRLLRDLKGTP